MDEQETYLRAISYAVSKARWLDISKVDPDKSAVLNDAYLLRSSSSSIIARIPLEELANFPMADIEALKVEGAVRSEGSSTASPTSQAVAWAISMGYPIPSKMGGCLAAILVVIGLFIYIVPGVLLLIWLFIQSNQYEQEMKKLTEKWIDAGRPAPNEGVKEVTRLERIVEKVDNSATPSASIEQRLVELNSMKEKGLITEEEFQAMRKKALDL